MDKVEIRASLGTEGLAVALGGEPVEEILILKSGLLSYEPGSAVSRWILPGTGKTQAIAKSELIDTNTGETLGEIVTAEAVTGGGLYSAGADRWILQVIAKGIAKELAARLSSGR